MIEEIKRHKPAEGVQGKPSHVYSEGVSLTETEYADSLLRSAALSKSSKSFGRHYKENGLIVLDQSSPSELVLGGFLEHEFVHRLLGIYRGDENFNPNGEYFGTDFKSKDWAEVVYDEELAQKYGVRIEDTEAIVLENYDRLNAYFTKVGSSNEIFFMEDEELFGEGEQSAKIDEVLTHYIAPHGTPQDMNHYNLSREQINKAQDRIMRLDKDCGFDSKKLVRRFSEFMSYEDLIEGTDDMDRVRRNEVDNLNGWLNSNNQSLKEKISQLI